MFLPKSKIDSKWRLVEKSEHQILKELRRDSQRTNNELICNCVYIKYEAVHVLQ